MNLKEEVVPIIVPLYFSNHLLEKFINAVARETLVPILLVFVDNTSGKGDIESYHIHRDDIIGDALSNLQNDNIHIRILELQENAYFSEAVNRGVKLAEEILNSPEYNFKNFIVMNPDCFPIMDNWVTEFLAIKSKTCSCATIGSFQFLNEEKTTAWHLGCRWKFANEEKCHPLDWKHLIDLVFTNYEYYQVDGNTGTGIMFDAEIFNKLGQLDHVKYPHYSSDADYCLRASQEGYNHICANIPMLHAPGNSSDLVLAKEYN